MKTKILNILLIVLALSACGSENNSYGWEYDYKYNDMRVRGESNLTPDEIYTQYEKAISCFGDKYPPFIIFTNEILKQGTACGTTFTSPPLIVISTDSETCSNIVTNIRHELTHYFKFRGHDEDFKKALQCVTPIEFKITL